jgi:hypothetical protein
MSKRDDFTAATRLAITDRAGHRCSNPTCRVVTSGPNPVESHRAVRIGVAAHITAAAPGGPRYDSRLTSAEQRHLVVRELREGNRR